MPPAEFWVPLGRAIGQAGPDVAGMLLGFIVMVQLAKKRRGGQQSRFVDDACAVAGLVFIIGLMVHFLWGLFHSTCK